MTSRMLWSHPRELHKKRCTPATKWLCNQSMRRLLNKSTKRTLSRLATEWFPKVINHFKKMPRSQPMHEERKKKKMKIIENLIVERMRLSLSLAGLVLILCLFSFRMRVHYKFFTLSLYTKWLSEPNAGGKEKEAQKKRASIWESSEPAEMLDQIERNYKFCAEE